MNISSTYKISPDKYRSSKTWSNLNVENEKANNLLINYQ